MLFQTSERVCSLNQLILLSKQVNALSYRLIFWCHPQMKAPLTGMIVKLDFDGLHGSWQCWYHSVIAEFCYQNCMWSLFEHTHLVFAQTAHGATCLGGIGGRKWGEFEHHLICSSAEWVSGQRCLGRAL